MLKLLYCKYFGRLKISGGFKLGHFLSGSGKTKTVWIFYNVVTIYDNHTCDVQIKPLPPVSGIRLFIYDTLSFGMKRRCITRVLNKMAFDFTLTSYSLTSYITSQARPLLIYVQDWTRVLFNQYFIFGRVIWHFISDRTVCFGDFLPMRTLCDACHENWISSPFNPGHISTY